MCWSVCTLSVYSLLRMAPVAESARARVPMFCASRNSTDGQIGSPFTWPFDVLRCSSPPHIWAQHLMCVSKATPPGPGWGRHHWVDWVSFPTPFSFGGPERRVPVSIRWIHHLDRETSLACGIELCNYVIILFCEPNDSK